MRSRLQAIFPGGKKKKEELIPNLGALSKSPLCIIMAEKPRVERQLWCSRKDVGRLIPTSLPSSPIMPTFPNFQPVTTSHQFPSSCFSGPSAPPVPAADQSRVVLRPSAPGEGAEQQEQTDQEKNSASPSSTTGEEAAAMATARDRSKTHRHHVPAPPLQHPSSHASPVASPCRLPSCASTPTGRRGKPHPGSPQTRGCSRKAGAAWGGRRRVFRFHFRLPRRARSADAPALVAFWPSR